MPDPRPILSADAANLVLSSVVEVSPEDRDRDLISNGFISNSSDALYVSTESSAMILESDAPDMDMPLFNRIGTENLEPYCWISALDDANTIAMLVGASVIEGESSLSKPVQYGGIISFKAVNEYGKHPYVEFELSDPDYQNPAGTDGSLIDRLKVGSDIEVFFGYKGANIKWNTLKIVTAEVSFNEGSAYLNIKAVHGGSFRAYSSSEVYSSKEGKLSIEVMSAALGYPSTKLNVLQHELDELMKQELASASVGLSYYLRSSGVHYRFDPGSEQFIIETPFKSELLKRGQKAMKVTYGYPISTIADIEYKKEYPKKGGSNTGGKRQNTDTGKKRIGAGVDVNAKEIVVYVRGTFLLNDRDNPSSLAAWIQVGEDGDRGAVSATSEDEVYKTYPREQGYLVERNTSGYISATGDVYNVKRVFNIQDLVESDVKTGPISDIEKKQGANNTYYVYQANSFIRENGQNLVSYRTYTATQVLNIRETKAAPKKTEREVVIRDGKEYVWQSELGPDNIAFIEKGYENTTFGSTSDPGYIQQSRLTSLRRMSGDNNSYRVREQEGPNGTTYYLERLVPVTETPEKGSVASKEEVYGPPLIDTVSGSDITSIEGTPKSQDPTRTTNNIGAVRALPKEEVTLRLKAGDWSMKVGRILEIVSLHKSVNGHWFINKEEHSVGTDGFNTTVTCRKARSSDITAFTQGKIKVSTGTSSSKSGDSEADQKTKAQEVSRPSTVLSTQEHFKARLTKEATEGRYSSSASYYPTRGRIR